MPSNDTWVCEKCGRKKRVTRNTGFKGQCGKTCDGWMRPQKQSSKRSKV